MGSRAREAGGCEQLQNCKPKNSSGCGVVEMDEHVCVSGGGWEEVCVCIAERKGSVNT